MIICKKFITANSSGFLLGFADFFLDTWGLNIRGCKVFQKNGQRWVKFPDQPYEKDGEKKYSPYLWFEDSKRMDEFTRLAIKAIDEFCAKSAPSVHEETPLPEPPDDDLPF